MLIVILKKILIGFNIGILIAAPVIQYSVSTNFFYGHVISILHK